MNAVPPRGDPITSDSASPFVETLHASAGDPVVVPGGGWFLRGTFARDGGDLLLSGSDGSAARISGYFDLDTPPALLSEGGARLSGDLVSRLSAPVQVAQSAGAVSDAAESIGQVETVQGLVEASRLDGTRVALAQGDPVYQGDTITTGGDGTVGIVFADDSTFSLDANGEMKLDELVYDPGAQTGSLAVDMVQGVFTFVSGQIAKTGPDAMTINTPVATIGVRGTAGAGTAAPEGQESNVVLLPEPDGSVGEMTVTTQAGTQTFNQPYQGASMTSAFQSPAPQQFTPDQVAGSFGNALNTLQQAQQSFQARGGNQGDAPADGEGDAPADGEGDAPADGEGDAPADGEGDGGGDGEGDQTAEGDAPVDGEGDAPVDGEGDPTADGEGDAPADGEGDAPADGDTPADAAAAVDAAEAAAEAAQQAAQDAVDSGATAEEAAAAATTAATDSLTSAFGTDTFGSVLGGTEGSGTVDAFTAAFMGTDTGTGGETSLEEVLNEVLNDIIESNQDSGLSPTTSVVNTGEEDNTDDVIFFDDFQEVLTATKGNDTLRGGDANTEFVMAQDLTSNLEVPSGTLGGVDSVDGGGGTDQITFDYLYQVVGRLDAASGKLYMWNWTYDGDAAAEDPATLDPTVETPQAEVTFTNVELVYFGSYDLTDDAQFSFNFGESFIGEMVAGGAGNDAINWNDTNSNGLADDGEDAGWFSDADGVLVFGGAGNDFIYGSNVSSGDVLYGGEGNDVIYGLDGADDIIAWTGDDTLYGGAGTDVLDGEDGNDFLYGGTESDLLYGGAGDDYLYGEDGDDILYGGDGNDTMEGGSGYNVILGGAGDDGVPITDGSAGNIIDGGTEDSTGDTLGYGMIGNSVTFNLTAGSVFTGDTTSPLYGLDVFTASRDSGANTDTFREIEILVGSEHNDTFNLVGDHTGGDLNYAYGLNGDDIFNIGNGSIDTVGTAILFGGAGNDIFNVALKGSQTAAISGDTGDDTVNVYGDVTTTIFGGSGADSVTVYAGGTVSVAGTAVDLGSGIDTATISGSVTGDIVGGTGADSVTVYGTVTGNIDLGGGTVSVMSGGNVTGNVDGGDGGANVTIGGTVGGNVYGGTGVDTFTITTGASITGAIYGEGLSDTLNLAAAGGSVSVSGIETINGYGGSDSVTLLTAQSSGTIDLDGGTDSLALADGGNTLSVGNMESLTGGVGADVLTAVWYAYGMWDLVGTGDGDQVQLFGNGSQANNISFANVETVLGSSDQDTVSLLTAQTSTTVTLGAEDDTLKVGYDNIVASNTFSGGTQVSGDVLELTSAGVIADAGFTNVSEFEKLLLDDLAGYDITLGSNAYAAFGAGLLVDGSALTSNGVNIDASGFNGNMTINLSANTAADSVRVGSGLAVTANLGGGNDILKIDVSYLNSTDSYTGGNGTDQVWFLGGGSVADSSFYALTGFETIVLANSVFNLSLDSAASSAFSSGINIDGQSVTFNGINIASSTGLTANLTLDLVNSIANDDIWTGSGTADNIVLGGGDDILRIGAADLSAGDTLNGGAGTDILYLDTGGTILGSAWGSGVKTGFETLQLSNGAFTVTFNDDAGTVFGGSINVDASLVTNASIYLDATAMSAANTLVADLSTNIGSTTLKGGAGADNLTGTAGADTIYGGAGDDIIHLGAGNDVSVGGEDGNDTIYGGDGNDSIEGDAGNDTLYGEGGDDVLLNGESGDDYLDGGTGNDLLSAGTGADTLIGGTGADTIQLGANDFAIDLIRYDSVGDGGAAGASTGYDTVTGFETGYDTIGIAGSLRTLVDDLSGSTSSIVWATDANAQATGATVNFATNAEALLISGFANDTDLTNLATVAGAIQLDAGGGQAGIILARAQSQSALYAYQETADANTISTNELQLLAVFDSATIGTSDVTLA